MIGGVFLAVLLVIFAHVGPSWGLLWIPLLLIILVAQTAAAALFFSCANVFFRDVKYIVQVLLTFGIFFTPVFYEPELFGPTGAQLMMLNPLSPALEGLRLAIVEQHNLMYPVVAQLDNVQIWIWHPAYLLYAGLVAVVGLVIAWLIFHRSEFIFAEYI